MFREELKKMDWSRVREGEAMVVNVKQRYGSLVRRISYRPSHLRLIADNINYESL